MRFSASDGCQRLDELWMFRWGYIIELLGSEYHNSSTRFHASEEENRIRNRSRNCKCERALRIMFTWWKVGCFWCIEISHKAKRKFKCLLTELKYCREDLVVQEDYYCCLNNLSLENNVVFCWIVHRDLFQHIKHTSSWPSGITDINSLLFSKLRMLPLIPWGEAALSLR